MNNNNNLTQLEQNLISELDHARSQGLIDYVHNRASTSTQFYFSYTPTSIVTIKFSPGVSEEAKINLAQYLNKKYLIFGTHFTTEGAPDCRATLTFYLNKVDRETQSPTIATE